MLSDSVSIARRAIGRMFKGAMDDFSFVVDSMEKNEDHTRVEGKFSVYSMGRYGFSMIIDDGGRVIRYDERKIVGRQ